MEEQVEFCSLGMFIVDEIEYAGGKNAEKVVIGGAGSYAALGARLVAGEQSAKGVSWIVDVGSDFPPQFRSCIESWQTNCIFREDRARLTTRAWNGYSGENEHRSFQYLTSKVRLDQESLSAPQIMAKAFHLVCSSDRCVSLVSGIIPKRERLLSASYASHDGQERALFVWEPVPELCSSAQRAKFQEAVRYVDIVSPNTEELLGFFLAEKAAWSEEQAAKEVLGWGIGIGQNGALVVRQGSRGCAAYVPGRQFHLRPYHLNGGDLQPRVVDPTGGGNAFLGALALAMNGKVTPSLEVMDDLRGKANSYARLLSALILATIAASFVIEQPGMPLLSRNGREQETWNGELFEDRLVAYLDRERDYIAQQLTRTEGTVPP